MVGATLMSWVATAGVGLSLIATWLERGGLGPGGLRRLTGRVLVAHVAPAVVGLFFWIAYAATKTAALAWIGCALLGVVAVWGIRNFIVWQRRRTGVLRATPSRWNLPTNVVADPHLPAEQHFPVAVVALHGVLGVTTLTLALLTAAGV
jgi:hypothetical protein